MTTPDPRKIVDEATRIKRRIATAAMGAQLNAKTHGGDVATASADLLCAFVLLSVKSGADPDRALAAVWESAKVVVSDFWPKERVN